MTLIWATRGRTWGFRFLRDGGFADPLPEYEAAFAGIGTSPTAWQRVGATVAVRFPDPESRRDSAGRVIPHELVIYPPLAERVNDAADALREVWPLLANEYGTVWESQLGR